MQHTFLLHIFYECLLLQIKYHEDFEKMKGTKLTVVDDPEIMRHKQNAQIVSNVEYHGLRDKQVEQERKRSLVDRGEHNCSLYSYGHTCRL